MNWQSHERIEFDGRTYGQKDLEFARFVELPRLVKCVMEVAVAGRRVPQVELSSNGWTISDAEKVTKTYDSYHAYIVGSLGEFSVCKNVFVDMRTAWFSDRSAAYLAAGRPVVLQDTGFSEHLPCGRGLFAVSNPEEAANAIDEILSDYPAHAHSAREIAEEYLDASKLMGRLLTDVGI
jgi:glycosyltransferase involved in cell wall biosynthesis